MGDPKPLITIKKDGPYVVSGVRDLTNSKGEHLTIQDPMSLCRCGQSKNKPFCDGSHRTAGFKDDKN
ncbi:CDGSH iron-sulfur domain-containing protein [bacterium]|nr:CDGSH iron-sulfur domain-containing protein [bacterium]MBU1985190.1 CDGSH iron-sulfur domain-containing protein [bacterium]